jgi:glucokinase
LIKGGVVDEKGQVKYFLVIQTDAEKGKEEVILRLKNLISSLLSSSLSRKEKILGIGIGSPGPIQLAEGIILTPPNLPGWKDVPLKDILEKEFGLPVWLNNDANCAMLGEHWLGAAAGAENAVMLTLGTGVGGGIIIENKLYQGEDGTAGELGHMVIVKDGRKCGCGNKGCLEAYASAVALEREAVKIGLKFLNARDIFILAKKGDKKAKKVIEEMIEFLATGIANLVNIFNPKVVVLGGGLIKSSDLFLAQLKEKVSQKAFKIPAKTARIVPAILGDRAGVLGAARLVFSD